MDRATAAEIGRLIEDDVRHGANIDEASAAMAAVTLQEEVQQYETSGNAPREVQRRRSSAVANHVSHISSVYLDIASFLIAPSKYTTNIKS